MTQKITKKKHWIWLLLQKKTPAHRQGLQGTHTYVHDLVNSRDHNSISRILACKLKHIRVQKHHFQTEPAGRRASGWSQLRYWVTSACVVMGLSRGAATTTTLHIYGDTGKGLCSPLRTLFWRISIQIWNVPWNSWMLREAVEFE